MKVRRLFKKDVYLKECQAKITSVSQADGKTLVTLDQTIFFPTGGGQSCDIGQISGIDVLDVYEYGDDIYHRLDCSPQDLAEGASVSLSIDWERRFDNMQRHCGEHILSGIFFREFGGVNRGFHMGDDYMTIDISLEEMPEFDKITWEMAKHAELAANEVIWNNLPVIIRHFNTKKEAEGLPLRKVLTLEKDISIVCVGSTDNPADCVACCGTHPSTAGQVGLIKIYKVESNKGMFRIYFEAGKRAFEKMSRQYDTLTSLANTLSAGEDDLIDKFKSQQAKNQEVRNNLHMLKKEVISQEINAIKKELSLSDSSAENMQALPYKEYNLLSTDDLSAIARELSESIPKLVFLVHNPTNTVFLCASKDKNTPDCGKLVKENASIYGGKGGGNKTMARAIFPKAEYIPVFIDLISKHLK